MRLCIQRVKRASVTVDGVIVGRIDQGLLVLVGVGVDDTEAHADALADKCLNLRIFEDAERKMNLAIRQVQGQVLAVSQFTLYADLLRGNRPSFTAAALPELGKALYERFCMRIREGLGEVQTGVFGAKMEVALVNDGPVTVLLSHPL
ncbi:MAG: D-aminoacyl-tRNA deacylase [Fibrobacterota bacterium]